MEVQYQLLAGALMGVFVFLFFLARDYWKRLSWLFGTFDPNMGFASEVELISQANKTMLLLGALALIWAIVGPSLYRRNWEIEVMGLVLGMLVCYVLIIRLASSRIRSNPH